MTLLFARTLFAIGLAGVVFSVVKLAVINPPAPTAYFTTPEGGPAHVHGCPYVDWDREGKDLIRLPGKQAAEKIGLCEHCLRGGSPPSTASARSHSPARAETVSHQTRQVDADP